MRKSSKLYFLGAAMLGCAAPAPAIAPVESAAPLETRAIPTLSSGSAEASSPDPPEFGFVAGSPQSTSYALVVGIEKYRDLPRASGARKDALKFASMLRKTLGLREDHVVIAVDDRATRTDLLKNIEWLKHSVKPGGRAYVYFSGHGAPDAGSGTAFMLPFDGDPKYVATTGIQMDEIVKALAGSRAQDALVIADTCFSGAGGRSQLAAGTRPLVKVKEPAPAARVTILSASGSSEISGPTKAGDEGLFTHHLGDALGRGLADADGDGQISLQEILDFVKPRVSREAKRDNRDQTPELRLGIGVRSASDFVVGYGITAGQPMATTAATSVVDRPAPAAQPPGPTTNEPRSNVIRLSSATLFPADSSALLPTGVQKLNEIADDLVKRQPGAKVSVEGYTDALGKYEANVELSKNRAAAVRAQLVARGIASDRITAVGYGPDRALTDSSTPENRASNRRIEIVVQAPAAN